METRKDSTRKEKNLYSKEYSNSADESDDDDTKVLFMGVDTQNDAAKNKNCEDEEKSEVEVEIYLEEELSWTHKESRKFKRRNQSLK